MTFYLSPNHFWSQKWKWEIPFYFEKKFALIFIHSHIFFHYAISPHSLWSNQNILSNSYLIPAQIWNPFTGRPVYVDMDLLWKIQNYVHFNSKQAHNPCSVGPALYKRSELSFTPLHIQHLNSPNLKNSTGKDREGKEGTDTLPKPPKRPGEAQYVIRLWSALQAQLQDQKRNLLPLGSTACPLLSPGGGDDSVTTEGEPNTSDSKRRPLVRFCPQHFTKYIYPECVLQNQSLLAYFTG